MRSEQELRRAYQAHRESDHHGSRLRASIRDIVLGGNDGIVTTFAVVAGTSGAQLSATVIIILGIANLLADGLSMGAGVFLSQRSERDRYARTRREEAREIDDDPEIEREEVREAFRSKGFEGAMLEDVVRTITANKERWVEVMLHEEHGLLPSDGGRPLLDGAVTFFAFVFFGGIPLLPYVFPLPAGWQFPSALASTTVALIILGIARSAITRERVIRGVMEIVGVGLLCAATAYGVGAFLRTAVGVVG